MPVADGIAVAEEPWNINHIRLASEEYVKPSDLLDSKEWVDYIVELFELHQLRASNEIDDEMKSKADYTVKLLRQRFGEFVESRKIPPSKQDHWVLKFARKNLSVVAAVMVLSDHLKMDISCLRESDSLLTNNINSFLPCLSKPTYEGAYGEFDRNRNENTRSGKCTRRGCPVRQDEHYNEAKKKKASSHFYMMYPAEESPRAGYSCKQGFFESLTQVIFACFDPKSEAAKKLDKGVDECGLLLLSDEDKKNIRSSMKDLASLQKFQEIVAYQFEFGYDLAIASGLNVSTNPGFESILGVF